MNRIWIKLYLELLDDVKLVGLPEAVCWRFVQLLLVAGERDEGGILPPTKQLAWRLRMDQAQLLDDLRVLSEVGVVGRQGERWKVTNFEKRQAAMTEAERAARYRARKGSSPGAAAVTSSDAAAVTDSILPLPLRGERVQGEGGPTNVTDGITTRRSRPSRRRPVTVSTWKRCGRAGAKRPGVLPGAARMSPTQRTAPGRAVGRSLHE